MEYLELARTYLECKEPKLSLKCLSYAKEFQLSAQLCEKLGKVWAQPTLPLGALGCSGADSLSPCLHQGGALGLQRGTSRPQEP